MNNERMDYLLSYMNGLERLNSDGYRCNNEIMECIGWIREELKGNPSDAIERIISGPASIEIHEGHSARIILYKDDVSAND